MSHSTLRVVYTISILHPFKSILIETGVKSLKSRLRPQMTQALPRLPQNLSHRSNPLRQLPL